MEIKLDCKNLVGEKPCKYKSLCQGCSYYEPMGKRILIIKLGAMGDVLRTTPLLTGLKEKYPESFIIWLVRQESHELLEGNTYIDKIIDWGIEAFVRLHIEEFDLVINLDKDICAVTVASLVKAKEKIGFGLSKEGNIFPLNKEAEYSFSLGISDELKFKINTKTYQETIFDIAGLKYNHQEYIFKLSQEGINYARGHLHKNNIRETDLLIGLNTGCGNVFSTKKWTIEGYAALIEQIDRELGAKVLLLGGPNEVERNRQIKKTSKAAVIDTGNNNTLTQFAGFIYHCNIVVTADTIALHLAIALKKLVVAIFGPTCSQEIDLYGRGNKIISRIDCAPCYKGSCADYPSCMEMISAAEVFGAIKELIKNKEK